MNTFLSLIASLFLLTTSVLAQGRPGVTRGQIFFGCYTARPTATGTQPAAIQAANSATFSGCLVSSDHSLLICDISQLTTRRIVVRLPPLSYSGIGKLPLHSVGAVHYFNSRNLNRLPTHPAPLHNGPMAECRQRLRHSVPLLVGLSPMLVLPLLPILKLLDLSVVSDSVGRSFPPPTSHLGKTLIVRSNRFAYFWGDVSLVTW
jgi:hypothetical protein